MLILSNPAPHWGARGVWYSPIYMLGTLHLSGPSSISSIFLFNTVSFLCYKRNVAWLVHGWMDHHQGTSIVTGPYPVYFSAPVPALLSVFPPSLYSQLYVTAPLPPSTLNLYPSVSALPPLPSLPSPPLSQHNPRFCYQWHSLLLPRDFLDLHQIYPIQTLQGALINVSIRTKLKQVLPNSCAFRRISLNFASF